MRATLSIHDPLFVSAPNGGGLLHAHRHLLLPLLQEDTTGLFVTRDGLLWCVQTGGGRSIREVRHGQLRTLLNSDVALDLHDVLAGPDGVYVACTETNEILKLGASGEVADHWRFGDEPDSSHVNSIAWHRGRLLASMFGGFTTHRGYKGQTRKVGRVVDVRSGEVLIEGLSQPHSLTSLGEDLWLCSSEDRAVHIYSSGFKLQCSIELPGYTRGLAVGSEFVYVGLSRSRNSEFAETGEFTSAVIGILDRASLEVLGYVPVPWNEIYDIRIASSELVTIDVMASLWATERHRQEVSRIEDQQEIADLRQKSDETLRAWQAEQDARMVAEQAAQAQAVQLQDRIDAMQRDMTATRGELLDARGEIVRNQAKLRMLEQLRAELELIKASRSWRWTRLWRVAFRMLRVRGVSDLDQQRLRQVFARRAAKPKHAEPRILERPLAGGPGSITTSGGWAEKQMAVTIEPAPQLQGRRDYFVWAVIDWHFRTQRPQHLSRELAAAGHRVFYISNNFVDDARPGFAVEPLDSEGMLFQIHLHLRGAPQIYHAAPDGRELEQLRAGLGELLAWTNSRGCVSLVQHPYWLETARILPDAKLAYDCMDHHGGFADNDAEILARETELMREADLLVVTSDWLYQKTGKYDRPRLVVRNACQYGHFAHPCANPFKDPKGRKIIGYYGAIAEWFDLDLIEKVAERFPDCLVLLVGLDTAGACGRLAHLPNVEFVGEVPYASLPAYLDGFDVCMLPFQVIPLTLATNPVKVYEYLSAGKNVVSVSLPEVRQFDDLVSVANDHGEFLEAVAKALEAPADPLQVERRQRFAAEQTWSHRVHALTEGIDALRVPRVSVIVVTYNNLDLTKTCLASIEQLSDYDNLEVIVVDNASADGTPDFLRDWAQGSAERKLILNSDNLGFAAANNQGLAMADGEYLVLLNNDTHVTNGWIATLMSHLRRDEKLGMVGPMTNNIGNEARIDVRYDDMDGMLEAAAAYTRRHAGQSMPLRTVAFFCAMMRRDVYEKVGPLDEAFGIGFFEDDDYCRRIEQAGWSIACAEDVFIHHHLSASFNKIKQEKRQAMFEQNKAIYEAKWGTWVPHKYRGSDRGLSG